MHTVHANTVCSVQRTAFSSQGEGDEGLLKESVESLIDYIRAAQLLVKRIEDAVDRYLFWDEEVQMYETVNSVSAPLSGVDKPFTC